jgi:hypothetical protein
LSWYRLQRMPIWFLKFGFSVEITDSQLRLSIVDPKAHIVLWPFIQHVENSFRETARRKKFDEAMTDLVEDIKKVTAQPAVAGK